MSLNVSLPSEYGYVILTVTGTFFVGFWHGARVSSFRKPAGMAYPKAYADTADMSSASPDMQKKMYLFNCAQRAHGNYLENHSAVALSMLIAGLRWPLATSLMGVAWLVSRIVYAVGYTRPDMEKGKGRLYGSVMWLFQLGLFGMVGTLGYQLLQ